MNPICTCDLCVRRRAQQLRDDLNALADKRVLSSINLDDLIPVETHWRPSWVVTTLLSIACASFAAGVLYEAIKHGLWLFLK